MCAPLFPNQSPVIVTPICMHLASVCLQLTHIAIDDFPIRLLIYFGWNCFSVCYSFFKLYMKIWNHHRCAKYQMPLLATIFFYISAENLSNQLCFCLRCLAIELDNRRKTPSIEYTVLSCWGFHVFASSSYCLGCMSNILFSEGTWIACGPNEPLINEKKWVEKWNGGRD